MVGAPEVHATTVLAILLRAGPAARRPSLARAAAPALWQGTRDATSFGNDCMQEPVPGDAAEPGARCPRTAST